MQACHKLVATLQDLTTLLQGCCNLEIFLWVAWSKLLWMLDEGTTTVGKCLAMFASGYKILSSDFCDHYEYKRRNTYNT